MWYNNIPDIDFLDWFDDVFALFFDTLDVSSSVPPFSAFYGLLVVMVVIALFQMWLAVLKSGK